MAQYILATLLFHLGGTEDGNAKWEVLLFST